MLVNLIDRDTGLKTETLIEEELVSQVGLRRRSRERIIGRAATRSRTGAGGRARSRGGAGRGGRGFIKETDVKDFSRLTKRMLPLSRFDQWLGKNEALVQDGRKADILGMSTAMQEVNTTRETAKKGDALIAGTTMLLGSSRRGENGDRQGWSVVDMYEDRTEGTSDRDTKKASAGGMMNAIVGNLELDPKTFLFSEPTEVPDVFLLISGRSHGATIKVSL